eukprot:CAMPEP_0198152312 /NCGR_PEP_ID=MMETSP1443-20131203/59331_1 /TAXON_ID=186043 /ORGANISM="Entomoneis sp., Strain CCMP2396" /LENGTH=127 /DNA_ID=CAMNT_0043818291 /DNA_START=14 /DNA_END=394 /DNA_ORIENTATION=+
MKDLAAFSASFPVLTRVMPAVLTARPVEAAAAYIVCANMLYLARRSYIRKMPMKRLWKIRTTREKGVSCSLYILILLAWQLFVMGFPVTETVARCCQRVSFFYSYPNASGCGIILEPISVQHLSPSP